MSDIPNKIDFSLIFEVKKANPNGDPLNGNLPRTDFEGKGEVESVALKRKIRNYWMETGEPVFVQGADSQTDGFKNLESRFKGNEKIAEVLKDKNTLNKEDVIVTLMKEGFLDVRAFGQVITFDKMSRGIRGAVSISLAESIDPVDVTTNQITKSVNLNDKPGMGSDRMGSKNRVEYGLYRMDGTISKTLADKNGFTMEDAEKLKEALLQIFEYDFSSARPSGSMNVVGLYWWEHNLETTISSNKVFDTLKIESTVAPASPTKTSDYNIHLDYDNYSGPKAITY